MVILTSRDKSVLPLLVKIQWEANSITTYCDIKSKPPASPQVPHIKTSSSWQLRAVVNRASLQQLKATVAGCFQETRAVISTLVQAFYIKYDLVTPKWVIVSRRIKMWCTKADKSWKVQTVSGTACALYLWITAPQSCLVPTTSWLSQAIIFSHLPQPIRYGSF